MPIDRKGEARLSLIYKNRKAAIKAFIENFKFCGTHYSRAESVDERYLPGNLSINKLHRMYSEIFIIIHFFQRLKIRFFKLHKIRFYFRDNFYLI